MANTGREYELFVASLQQAILDAENITTQKNIQVEVNKKIVDNSGIERQFDIYWEYELGGFLYKTIIECKDYDSNVSVEKIDALIGKIRDLPDLRAVFATKKGYQSGARTKANTNRIDLLIVREQNESDWTDTDGTPFIKKIVINMHICSPAQITKFRPELDGEWIKENTDIDISSPITIQGQNNEIFIDDLIQNERYSLYQLANRLAPIDGQKHGQFAEEIQFDNAYLYHKDIKLKLRSYRIEYFISKPAVQPIEIDFSKELIGVVEYLQSGHKKSIFKDGVIR